MSRDHSRSFDSDYQQYSYEEGFLHRQLLKSPIRITHHKEPSTLQFTVTPSSNPFGFRVAVLGLGEHRLELLSYEDTDDFSNQQRLYELLRQAYFTAAWAADPET